MPCYRQIFPMILGVAAAALCATAKPAAPPEVTSFHPTGVQRGQTAEIVANGNLGAWPPKIWSEMPGLIIEPAADKGKLKVTAAADAPLGIHWIRLADAEGAAAPRPLLVGNLPEIAEKEPNHAISEAQPIEGQQVVSGKLAKRGDVDVFAVPLQAGQTLVADLLANELFGSPMDGVLQICSPGGFVLAQDHDTRGLDPRLVFNVPAAGTYYVRLFAFPSQADSSINFAGGDNYLYRLTLTTGPYVDHTLPLALTRDGTADLALAGWNISSPTSRLEAGSHPWRDHWLWHPPGAVGLVPLRMVDHPSLVVEPSASRESPQNVPVPVTLTGELESPRDIDAFSVVVKKAQRLEIRVESSSLGYDVDPVVSVVDASGKTVAEEDDGRRNERDPVLTFSPPADGTYQVLVRDLHGRGGMRMVYRCTIAEPKPDFSLTVPSGSHRLASGMTVEIPVAINRRDGFKDEIEISAVDLPAGITADIVRSPAEGDASKSVKLVLKAGPDAQAGPFRILGKAAGSMPLARPATFETAQGDAKFDHRDFWLAVGAAK